MPEQDLAPESMVDAMAAVEDETFFPTEHTMKIGDKVIQIRALALGQFRKMVDEIGKFFMALALSSPDVELDAIGTHLDSMLMVGANHVTPFISALTGIEEAYIDEHMTIRDVAQFVRLTLQVNDLPGIIEDFSLAARLAGKQLKLPALLSQIQEQAGPDGGAAPSTS